MASAINVALHDAHLHGAGDQTELRHSIEALACVDPISWGYEDLVGATARFAGISQNGSASAEPMRSFSWPPGGNSPGELLHEVANRIAEGEFQVAVLVGCETLYSVRRARKESIDLHQQWTPFTGKRDFFKGQRPLTTPLEARHGMVAPIHGYPMLENAIRAARGRSVAEHQSFISALMSRNAEVAASNPYAWFPESQSAEHIGTIDANNRWVCFPYPKRMNAIMEVDQAAAVVLMSQAEADRRGIARVNQVVFLGGGSCQDPWTPAERPDLSRSEGIAAAGQAAFSHAGITMEQVDAIDLYSCFPSAIQLGMDALGIAHNDPRGVTMTGGLAYAGGPGNSYALHSMCVATERIRSGQSATALVTSLGMTASKHAVSLFGNDGAATSADSRAHKEQLSEGQLFGPPLVDETSGTGKVVSYTAEFDRSGVAVRTIYIIDLDNGTRTVGNGACEALEVENLLHRELVGAPATVMAGTVAEDGAGQPNRVVLG